MTRACRTLHLCVLTGLLPVLALAAEKKDDASERSREKHREYSMGEITVRAEAPPLEVVDVDTITAEEIEARNARTVAEALEVVPGIRVSTGRKAEPMVSIHGFDQSRISVMIDGVPYYETFYGRLDLNQIPTTNIARIEVSKGAASVLYGANALGGVINIITKQATDEPFTSGTIEAGESDLRVFSATRGAKHGRLSYWFNYSRQEREGWELPGGYEARPGEIIYRGPSATVPALLQGEGQRTNSDVERDALWFKVGFDEGPDSQYWLNFHYLNMTKGLPPDTESVRVFLFRPAFSQLGRMPDYRDRGVDFDVRERLAERLFLKGKLFYHRHEDNYDSYADTSFSERLARSTFQDSILGGTAILESPLTDTHTMRFALNYKRDVHEQRADEYLPYARTASYTGSVGLENELLLSPDLRVVVGLSFDWYDVSEAEQNLLDRDGNFIGKVELATLSTEELHPMLGLNWSLGGGSKVFASIGRKSRFPLLSQLYSSRNGNPELEPETSTNFVVGYEKPLSESLSLEASGFWYEISGLISRSGTDPLSRFQNYEEVRVRGLELTSSLRPVEGLTLGAHLTWMDAENRSEGSVTDEVINSPEFSGMLSLHWQLRRIPAKLAIYGTYTDEVFNALPSARFPDDPIESVDAAFLTRVRVGYDILPGVEIWGSVRNLFDENYQSEFGFPGRGREVSIGLSAEL